ncbi:alpha/beta fold hydrolase [Rhodococcus sp. NPDC003318]|uniref:alpha/beta fold hydrolase n=1 Tax=Rhodococcus sp. NPDC003318 TaxID=3364503 RepID=UPI0036B63E62
MSSRYRRCPTSDRGGFLTTTSAAVLLASALTSCGVDTTTPEVAGRDFTGTVRLDDGRELYLECRGTGSPTVVLQSGYGNAADVWSLAEAYPPAVLPGLSAYTRVCAYDRPGALLTTTDSDGTVVPSPVDSPGRSDQVPMPRNTADVVAELHELLATAGEQGPFVLVGHSLGGALSLLYARTHPGEVQGLVTVDAAQPELRSMLAPQEWALFADLRMSPDSYPSGYQAEAYSVDELFDRIEAAPPLPAIPVVVMVRGEPNPIPDPLPPNVTAESLQKVNDTWPRSQAAFAAGVPGAEIVTVPGTTHYVQTQRPDSVIDATKSVIARATSAPR